MTRKKFPGLHFAFERDATTGWEYLVQDSAGRTILSGWTAGTKRDAVSTAESETMERVFRGAFWGAQ